MLHQDTSNSRSWCFHVSEHNLTQATAFFTRTLSSFLDTPRNANTLWHQRLKAWYNWVCDLNLMSAQGSSPFSTFMLKIKGGVMSTSSPSRWYWTMVDTCDCHPPCLLELWRRSQWKLIDRLKMGAAPKSSLKDSGKAQRAMVSKEANRLSRRTWESNGTMEASKKSWW